MPTVLVRHDLPIGEALREHDIDVDVRIAVDTDNATEMLPAADVLIVNNETWSGEFLSGLDAGNWIQTTSMGYEAFPLEDLRSEDVRLTNAADNYTDTVAEHALALILGLARDLPGFVDGQREGEWVQDLGKELIPVAGATVTIVGLGNIGNAVAERAQAFDVTVQGTKRRPDAYEGSVPRDSVHPPTELHALLPETDFLVLAVPLTDDTHHLIDEGALAALPDQASLVNVSRGPVVDEDALVAAIESDGLARAGIDVFGEEPLPVTSPLWDLENVILTPHIAGRTNDFVDRFVDVFAANVERYRRGDDLENRIV